MKTLKTLIPALLVLVFIYACGSSNFNNKVAKEEPVRIANDTLEYEIIIIDPGFNAFLSGTAQPEGFYSQKYMEARNIAWVIAWNQRVLNPSRFNPVIYQNIIDYDSNIDYGYDVNYKLFNYFLFAQRKYNMSLGNGFTGDRIN